MISSANEYTLGETLHDGRRTVVYRALRNADGRAVILKMLRVSNYRPEDLDRLKNEFELGRLLEGAAIVRPCALLTFEGLPTLELEDAGGVPLERLVGTAMPLPAFLRLAVQISAAVAGIHGRGVIHKDLKPANILFDSESGQVKISDFGIASRLAREQTLSPPAGLIEGSLRYISPEQTGRTNRAIDSRSDLYSLGVTLYQLLTGRLPFEATDAVGWVHAHVARTPPAPDQVRPSVPTMLSTIILKLLAKLPDDRYQSARGLTHDLERCLADFDRCGEIDPFLLGERDISDRFLIPQKLYGRDPECAALFEAFERVAAKGKPELVLVSGYSGIGKSAVVRELRRPIVARRGFFIAGKFERHKHAFPYYTIIQALRELVLELLAEREDRVADWRRRIEAALKRNGRLITELVPQLELLIGPQPPVSELPLSEAENRQRMVFLQLFGAFASTNHPLTLFLDDLQWADPASLKLLVDLMSSSDIHHLLLLGAYRDNEIAPSDPLTRALDQLGKTRAVVQKIVLAPLSESDVTQFVANTVHCSTAEAVPLAKLVREKTGGNPFFAIQFLTALYDQGLITFDRTVGRWGWDAASIRAQAYTDNVGELMVSKLRHLPAETQEALKLCACVGTIIDDATLALVFERDPKPVLRPAVEAELLLRLDHLYRFPHDRVQEAAYSLVPEDQRPAVHLRIGRLLLAHTPPEVLEDRVFEILNQIDRGADLIKSQDEREWMAELNLMAGRRAQKATAAASALKYLTAGAAFLAGDTWERRHELTFALQFHRAQCEYLTGDMVAAEQRLGRLSQRAANLVDAAAVTCARMDLYTTMDRGDRSVEACLEYLRRVGIDWSAHPTDEEVRQEYQQLWQRLGSRPIEELVELPRATAPDHRATMDVITSAVPPAIFFDENLYALLVGRTANLSLQHGNSDSSCVAYVWLGDIIGLRFGDYRAGYRFGKLGLDLVEKHGLLRFKARVYVCFGLIIDPWVGHVHTSLDLLRRSFATAEETGDLTWASYACAYLPKLLFDEGGLLSDVQREMDSALEFVRKAEFGLMTEMVTGQRRLVQMLRGRTAHFGRLDDDDFDEARFEQRLASDKLPAITVCWYWLTKLRGRFLAGDYAAAVEARSKAAPLTWTLQSYTDVPEYHFYGALALAAQYGESSAEEQVQLRKALDAHDTLLSRWAGNCPANFEHRAALVAAEIARIDGDPGRAMELYEQAIRAARDNRFVQYEALAYETASRFYRARGFEVIADAYVREASARYHHWGAQGKVRHLERLHPRAIPRQPIGPVSTLAIRPEQLDLLSVVKALQTISGVMDRDELLQTLLRVVLEEGGARRARVILLRGGEWTVVTEAEADGTQPGKSVNVAGEESSSRIPTSVLRYVQRTEERVLIDDAAADAGRFSGDDYLARTRPRSVLCLPIRRQAELVGLLYLENDLVPGSFTPERLLALELLAAQTAISLENALLLEREHAARVDAEAAGQRALILGEATALMSSTLKYEGVFDALTRLCVRSFADCAIIDSLEPSGKVVRLAATHRDPSKESLLHELSQRYPTHLGLATPVTSVLQGGAPIHMDDLSYQELRSYCDDDRQAQLVQALGARSAIIVPLIAREAQLGALILMSAVPHRYSPADIELAAEMGRRAALAIDNARLLHKTQRAVRLRDEFLAIASHELRTPMTTLGLTVESLLHSATTASPVSAKMLDRSLKRVLRMSERLQHLSGELLDVTRIEKGELVLNRTRIDLGTLVREVVTQFDFELSSAGCRTSITYPAVVVGDWDGSRLEQVVTNLLSNAIKFGAGHPIDISVGQSRNVAELVVRDHGIGINAARLPYVFDRFERAVPSVHYGGLGLGLYITRWIVLAHGGTISVESELGAGTTFTVTLPLTVPQTAARQP